MKTLFGAGWADSTPWSSSKVAAAAGIPTAPPAGNVIVRIHCLNTSLLVNLAY